MPFSTFCLITLLFLVSIDKNFTAPNFGLVNKAYLNRILRSEIFLHMNGQLHVTHIILEYKPISSSFQSPKNVIKAKDPWLHQISIAVPVFLTKPPLEKEVISSSRLACHWRRGDLLGLNSRRRSCQGIWSGRFGRGRFWSFWPTRPYRISKHHFQASTLRSSQ